MPIVLLTIKNSKFTLLLRGRTPLEKVIVMDVKGKKCLVIVLKYLNRVFIIRQTIVLGCTHIYCKGSLLVENNCWMCEKMMTAILKDFYTKENKVWKEFTLDIDSMNMGYKYKEAKGDAEDEQAAVPAFPIAPIVPNRSLADLIALASAE